MPTPQKISYDAWPSLSFEKFAPTAHLLHMGMQAIGKLKLLTPFEPEWANVALWLTSRGVTTGPIPFGAGVFSIDVDFIDHRVICTTSWGSMGDFRLMSMSVAHFTKQLFDTLHNIGVAVEVNPKPQEIPNPILFDKDTEQYPYDEQLANAWWRILLSSYRVMQRYHAHFNGKTPPIGLMWGTFDLRDARYTGQSVGATGVNAGYLRRNAMDESQVEIGWWAGNEIYPRPAYFSFTYPQPEGIEKGKVFPKAAHWDGALSEFILDYEDVRLSKNPEKDLLDFFESTYQVGAKKSGWRSELIVPGKPI